MRIRCTSQGSSCSMCCMRSPARAAGSQPRASSGRAAGRSKRCHSIAATLAGRGRRAGDLPRRPRNPSMPGQPEQPAGAVMTESTAPMPTPEVERDVMEYDVVTVGAGPSGLAFAIRLKQLNPELSVCVIEKASTVGAHILSGAVIEPGPLDALLPGWRDNPPPVCVPATEDEFWLLTKDGGTKLPVVPPGMRNHGNFIVSLGAMCAWLAPQAEALGVE